MSTQANILIVDDTPANLHLLVGLLKDQGYKVRPAPNGKHALTVARSETIDLILLDIMMPEMDGYEVCRQFKSQKSTRNIPIIFLSALKETGDKVKAFEAGGVDYINKPFQAEEVLARVRTQIGMHRMQQQLQVQNTQLQEQQAQLELEIVERRNIEKALREANAAKDTFFSIIAHDLRSPFTVLFGFADHALKFFDALNPEELKAHIREMRTSAKSVFALLENLLAWSRIQRGVMDFQPRSLPLDTMLSEIFQLFRPQAEEKQIRLCRQIPDTVSVHADANMFSTVIRNLLSNALKFTHHGGKIEISAQVREHAVEISISDNGIGIPEEGLSDLFRLDVKTTTLGTSGEKGTGLGLPLCKDLLERNGGTISVISLPDRGTTFLVTLPGSRIPDQSAEAVDTRASLSAKEEDSLRGFSEQPHASHTHTSSLTKETLTAALGGLPKARQAELRYAAVVADIQALERIVEQIRQQNAPLAEALNSLLYEYNFVAILQAFEAIEL